MRITPEMTIAAILEALPGALSLFKAHGMGKFEAEEVRQTLGSVLKLRTALSMARVDVEVFTASLNAMLEETGPGDFAVDYSAQRDLTMLGLMPCGMKMPFKRRFDEFAARLTGSRDRPFHYLIEGNVNHELSYYPYIDTLNTIDELPDVIVSADINSFLHHRFIRNFVVPGYFHALPPERLNPDFAAAEYLDPAGQFTMLSANILVLVVNRRHLDELPVPGRWSDLLDPIYADSVVMRGQDGFFCSGVLMPFYRWFGFEGIKIMARTVKAGLHPAEMVEQIEKNRPEAAPFYIMPLFFAQRLKDRSTFDIVFPAEGAIISPVFMLLKKDREADAAAIAEFITGREMGQFCADAGFPSVRSDVDNHLPPGCKLSWMGWDFIREEDPAEVKTQIEKVFCAAFKNRSGS